MQVPSHFWSMLEEIKMRGRVMQMSADLEMVLFRIIMYSVIEDPIEVDREYRKLSLGKKVEMMRNDLKKYHPSVFKKHIGLIKKLDKITEFRNIIAHKLILWDEDEKGVFLLFRNEERERREGAFIKGENDNGRI